MKASISDKGIRIFLVVWLGQFVSTVGSGLTGFSLSVYIFQQTGQATQLGLALLAATLPGLLIGPIAGALIDRWDRKWAMLLSDTGAGLSTLWIWYLLATGNLDIWHIYIANAAGSFFAAFQRPAYMALPTVLVPKQHFGRASGLMQMTGSITQLTVPLMAGFLVGAIQIQGILLIDFATYLFAVGSLLLVQIPKARPTQNQTQQKESLLKEAFTGWLYLKARTGLMGLLLIYASVNFALSFNSALLTPMVLSFSTPEMLGIIISAGGFGALIGSLIISAWGGAQRKILSILPPLMAIGFFFSLSGLRPNVILIAVANGCALILLPIVNGSSHAIWNAKVATDVQGRVYAIRFMLGQIISPVTYLIAGPLADHIFEPLMMPGEALAGTLGKITGVGPGRGMGLILIIMGMLISLATLLGWPNPRVRNIETELPDCIGEASSSKIGIDPELPKTDPIPAD